MNTPVILILFRRPETTRRVFEAIRQARPPKLYIVADGARGPDDDASCESARAIVANIDWPCEVIRDYADTNLGVAKRVSSGITGAFRHYEEAIILEDDTLPNPFFFKYCEELLARWREEERIQHISGTNFIHCHQAEIQHSYYFNNHPAIWGWATWRRAWQHYDTRLPHWPEHRKEGLLERKLHTTTARQNWTETFDLHHDNEDPWTWDYHWTYATWVQNGLAAAPRQNLVTNIGFGEGATHTGTTTAPDLPIDPSHDETIVHPQGPDIHEPLNRWLEEHLHKKQPNKFQRGLSKLRKILHV